MVIMSNFIPSKHHLREILLHYFILKKSAAQSHRLLVAAYGVDNALSEPTCREWFRRFKTGDFDVKDKQRSGQPRKIEDKELKAILDEDSCRTLEQLADIFSVDESTISKRLKTMKMIKKNDNWCQMD